MSEKQSESADMEMEIELPPALAQFLNLVRQDQRKLLKDKSFAQPDQLRKFVSLNLMERFIQAVEMLGTTAYDIHQLSVSNARQLQRMKRWTAKHLRKLGAEVSDGEAFAGVGTEHINTLGQALYALGTHIQAKYPGDKDTEVKFNTFVKAYNQLIEALMGDQSVDDDEDDEDGEDEDEDEESNSDPEAEAEAAVDPEAEAEEESGGDA